MYLDVYVFGILHIQQPHVLSLGDSLANPELSTRWYHNGQRFSAKDKDQDSGNRHCAELYHGGWWFANCYATHLNGEYHAEGEFADTDEGIT